MSDHGILKALPEILREGLITEAQAEAIRAHYRTDPARSGDRSRLLFSVMGALLIGLGLVLVVAHNWDDLPKMVRTLLAFAPLLIGQVLCVIALTRSRNLGMVEGAALFLTCAVAAMLSLLAQIHHIPGSLGGFLFIWAWLIIGLVYVMRSTATAIVFLAITTWYALDIGVGFTSRTEFPYWGLAMLAAVIPFAIMQAKERGNSAAFYWLAFCSALAIGAISQLFWHSYGVWHVIGSLGMALNFLLITRVIRAPSDREAPRLAAFTLIGGASALVLLFVFSWEATWEGMDPKTFISGWDLVPWALMVGSGVFVFIRYVRGHGLLSGSGLPEAIAVFPLIAVVGLMHIGLATFLVNLLLIVLGTLMTLQGIRETSLRRMNLGLVIIATTILMRFFDMDLSYALRGIIFMAMGTGFLFLNLRLIRKNREGHAA